MSVTIHHGDSREVLKTLADASIDSVVCDPPYALVSIGKRLGKPGAAPIQHGKDGAYARAAKGFMGKTWDTGETAFAVEFWAEVYRVLKPGGHVVAFSGTRTYHRITCAIEDAGFEIRDMLSWLYGSGFPKSHDVSKGIDKALGHERAKVRVAAPKNPPNLVGGVGKGGDRPWVERAREAGFHEAASPEAASPEAASWSGWGTALKPACEPIVLARKPLDGTVAGNVLKHGTGALNINASRVGWQSEADAAAAAAAAAWFASTRANGKGKQSVAIGKESRDGTNTYDPSALTGRWPANVLHDGSEEVAAAFPQAPGQQAPVGPHNGAKASVNVYGDYGARDQFNPRGDGSSAARFFYSAKADQEDRLGSKHPTVKPVDLMAWLCRLVTPPKVVAFVCETCDSPPYDATNLQTLRRTADQPPPGDILLREMPDGGGEAAAPPLQGVRQGDQPPAPEALLARVPGDLASGSGEDASSEALRLVQDGVQTQEGRRADLLQPVLRGEGRRDGEAQGADQDLRGVLAGLSTRPPDGGQDGLLDGASPHHGGTPGAQPTAQRGRASSQRGQGRQPPAQPRTDDEGGTRPHGENAEESAAQLPPLSGPVHAQQLCPHCQGRLTSVERPGVVLDPFAGSGSTGLGAMREGFDCILIEREAEYVADIRRRVAWAQGEGRLTVLEKARDLSPSDAAGNDLPLFATQETAQPASQPASASSTAASPATPHRPNGDDEMVAA